MSVRYLPDELGWESVYAYNAEVLGTEATLDYQAEHSVLLTRYQK